MKQTINLSGLMEEYQSVFCTSSVNNNIQDMNEQETTIDNDSEDMDCDSGARKT